MVWLWKKIKIHFRYFGNNPIDINNNIVESLTDVYLHVYIKMMVYAPVSSYDQRKEHWEQASKITEAPDKTFDREKVCFDLAHKHSLELKNQTTVFELTVF